MLRLADRTETQATSFNAIRISIASPEQIMNWSHGEVTKPETINYRTLRPEKDGLFCERLFGPTKDWECFCGKYKRIRYRGIVCDRCGVEVTRSKVRRERMGHITLAAPVAHIWFSKTTPSRLGLLLDLSPRNLERVLYFAQHIIVSVDEDARQERIEEARARFDFDLDTLREAAEESLVPLREKLDAIQQAADDPEISDPQLESERVPTQVEIDAIADKLAADEQQMEEKLQTAIDELEDLRVYKLLAESRYRELKDAYGGVFQAAMGAEAVMDILRTIDLEALRDQLLTEMRSTSGQRRKKAIKRLRVVESFRNSGNHVEDMIMSVLPVLPPELRPMVQLDGGRFATSDLNDLYRRVINRNNRLKRLITLEAPEIIVRNEKRMLQEAVDALIDNGRRGRPIQGSHNHKLKSLSDLLRGKQGRFRQNLLGKRVDYSGRSVIVVGPELEMHQCGLPKRMALELFKPFVMNRLVVLGIAPNIKNAKRMVERARPEVWDILEDVIRDRPVLLNRAPTLHRLGIQAFMPVLIEGNAIQLHPLVCSAFNADFDGDQMAVHVPLSRMAVLEARESMLSTHNMLSPASGDPLVSPTLDMVMGCYYLTEMEEYSRPDEPRRFKDSIKARIAYESDEITLRERIYVRSIPNGPNRDDEYLETTMGRLFFNEVLPGEIEFRNEQVDRGVLRDLTAELHRNLSNEETARVLDQIKDLGFEYATSSGITIAISDIHVPDEKSQILAEASGKADEYYGQYQMGLISEDERYDNTVDAWQQASYKTTELVKKELANYGGLAVMANSGTKGNISQINQMAGMRGLVYSPGKQTGRQPDRLFYELPVQSSFREGLTALEYFISTHGSRKGLTDTALNTANSGYLTRRLIDVSQEIIIQGEDCGTLDGWAPRRPDAASGASLQERIQDRLAAARIVHPVTGEILAERNDTITEAVANQLVDAGIAEVPVRSPLTCESPRGVCQKCYGHLPATGMEVQTGQAVGIIAAQSIGEPGTQLTMRTFHTGGAVGARSRRDEDNLGIARDLQAMVGKIRENQGHELPVVNNMLTDAGRFIDARDRAANVLRAIEQSGVPAEQLAAINRMRDDVNLLSETRELAAVMSRIVENADGLRQELQRGAERLGGSARELQTAVRELQSAVNRIIEGGGTLDESGELQLMVGRIREDDARLNLELQEVKDKIPEDEDTLRSELLPVLDRIQEDLEQRGDELQMAVNRMQAVGTGVDEETFRMARDLYAALRAKEDRYCAELLGEQERIRRDVEARNLDITGGLPRVEELFEARTPKDAAILAEIDGKVSLRGEGDELRLRLSSLEEYREEYTLPENAQVLVDEGEQVEPGMVLATFQAALPPEEGEAEEDVEADDVDQIIASVGGRVEVSPDYVSVVWEDEEAREYPIHPSKYLRVTDGDDVSAGVALTSGPLNPHDILNILGKEALQSHLVELVQAVYQSQGVRIHDKHIEVILRQMLRRVQVESTGDCDLIPGQVVDRFVFQEKNDKVLAEGGEPATAKQVLLGITRASLLTDSFLSAASFQETTRVLTEAAVSGRHDALRGLKENVIIGRLIPAQTYIPGMEELLQPDTAPELAGIAPGGWLINGGDASGIAPMGMEDEDAPTPDDGFFAGPEEDPPIDGPGFLGMGPTNGDHLLDVGINPFAAPDDGADS